MEHPPLQSTPVGAFRFNTDSSKMEYYDGNQWVNITSTSPEAQTGGTRGIWGGGQTVPSILGNIEYVNIDTTGDSIDFGSDLVANKRRCGGFGSRTRGFIAGGSTPTAQSTIDFVTFASTGTTTAWGTNLNNAGTCDNMGFADSTRGIVKAGTTSPNAAGVMDYVTMSSAGTVGDFGDLIANGDAGGACASPTRGVMGGGYQPANDDTMTYVTISTLGNAADFGNLTVGRFSIGCCSNAVRGVWGGGDKRAPAASTNLNFMDYATLASLGNAVDFGDLSEGRSGVSAVSSRTRGVWGGGYKAPAIANSDCLDYVQFASTGNAVDFGNLTVQTGGKGGSCSNGHGGLG